jgi:hypothetical protein
MPINKSRIKVDGFLKIEAPNIPENLNGTWKITDAQEITDVDGEVYYRMEIDKNTRIKGDEYYVEWWPIADANTIFITQPFDSFPIDKAMEWPPPMEIICEDIEYFTLDEESEEEDHLGFEATVSTGQKLTHWEYLNEDADRIFQILLEDNQVTIYTGVRVNAMFVESI